MKFYSFLFALTFVVSSALAQQTTEPTAEEKYYNEMVLNDPRIKEADARGDYLSNYRKDPQWNRLDDFAVKGAWSLNLQPKVDFVDAQLLLLPKAPEQTGVVNPVLGLRVAAEKSWSFKLRLTPSAKIFVTKPAVNFFFQRENDGSKISLILSDEKGRELRPILGFPEYSWTGWGLLEFFVPTSFPKENLRIVGIDIEPDPLNRTGDTLYFYFSSLGQGPGYTR